TVAIDKDRDGTLRPCVDIFIGDKNSIVQAIRIAERQLCQGIAAIVDCGAVQVELHVITVAGVAAAARMAAFFAVGQRERNKGKGSEGNQSANSRWIHDVYR